MVVVLVVLALGGLTACGDDGDPVSVGGTPDGGPPEYRVTHLGPSSPQRNTGPPVGNLLAGL